MNPLGHVHPGTIGPLVAGTQAKHWGKLVQYRQKIDEVFPDLKARVKAGVVPAVRLLDRERHLLATLALYLDPSTGELLLRRVGTAGGRLSDGHAGSGLPSRQDPLLRPKIRLACKRGEFDEDRALGELLALVAAGSLNTPAEIGIDAARI